MFRILIDCTQIIKLIKVPQDSGTHDSKTKQAEKVEIFDDQFLVFILPLPGDSKFRELLCIMLSKYLSVRNFVMEGVGCQPPSGCHSSITNFLIYQIFEFLLRKDKCKSQCYERPNNFDLLFMVLGNFSCSVKVNAVTFCRFKSEKKFVHITEIITALLDIIINAM